MVNVIVNGKVVFKGRDKAAAESFVANLDGILAPGAVVSYDETVAYPSDLQKVQVAVKRAGITGNIIVGTGSTKTGNPVYGAFSILSHWVGDVKGTQIFTPDEAESRNTKWVIKVPAQLEAKASGYGRLISVETFLAFTEDDFRTKKSEEE